MFCIVLPTIFAVSATGHLVWPPLSFALIYILLRCLLSIRIAWIRVSTAVIGAAYYLALYLLIAYELYSGSAFDSRFFLHASADWAATAIGVFGALHIMTFIGAVFLLVAGMFLLLLRLPQCACMRRHPCRILSGAVAAALIANVVPNGLSFFAVAVDEGMVHAAHSEEPIVAGGTANGDNIFIVQLESANALALGGYATIDGKRYDGDYMPVMRKLAKNGIWHPLFWNNAVQTNRAQATILCGIIGNIGKSYSFRPEDVQRSCLPQMLADMGYSTAFMRSDRLGYANTGKFMKSLGMRYVPEAASYMHDDDIHTQWGYDDCAFYTRAIPNVFAHYTKRDHQFTYMEVSANHIGFPPRDEYKDIAPFPAPTNFIERYLNSANIQDHCLETFMSTYQRYAPPNTHLFILGDHAWPVGIHGSTANQNGATTDNFLVPFLYIPPHERRSEFAVGTTVHAIHSQTDIIPTILELITGNRQQNSLVPLWAKNGPPSDVAYDDCHVLTQPYSNPTIAVVRDGKKYNYLLNESIVERTNINDDLLENNPPLVIESDMDYLTFRKRYFCKRFLDGASGVGKP